MKNDTSNSTHATPQFWRISDLCRELNLSRTAMWKIRKDISLKFPQPHMLGETQLWNRDEILSWMQARKVAA